MRTIRGYVVIGKSDRFEFLFGKPVGQDSRDYENLKSNKLTPFETLEQARKVAPLLRERSHLFVSLGRISMKIAEEEIDLDSFRHERGLVVITKGEDSSELLGPLPEGEDINSQASAHPLPGAYLSLNGYQTYDESIDGRIPFEDAMYQSREVNRQAQCGATIAKFELERLED